MRFALLAALLGVLITGCGGVAGGDRPDEDVTLLLDSRPAAVHAGVYLATERGFDEAEGVEVDVERPGSDPVARVRDGRADMALLGLRDLAAARDLVGVYAVDQPLPRLVLAVKRTTLEDDRPLVRAVIRALQRGYAQAQVEPDSAVLAVEQAAPGLDRAKLAAEFDRLTPAFTAGARAPGELRRDVLERWAARQDPPVDVDETFDFGQVGPIRNP